ncbi:MAG: hypothetical protein IKE81_03950 [Clostridia bacterium]|nr:hypothetical protein [Clostridia bacterium]
MRKPFRLLIAVPCMDYVHADFLKSLVGLQSHLQREGINHHVEIVAGTLIYFARDKLACKAINEGFTHLLFLDSDMVFDENIVETLAFCGKDFVCGAFQARRPPYGKCVYSSLEPLKKVESWGMEPFRVKGCGMACTMIGAEVLTEVQRKYGTCFSPEIINGVKFGEDLAFCWRANKIGAEIWCEPTARCGHIAHVAIWPGEEPAT